MWCKKKMRRDTLTGSQLILEQQQRQRKHLHRLLMLFLKQVRPLLGRGELLAALTKQQKNEQQNKQQS